MTTAELEAMRKKLARMTTMKQTEYLSVECHKHGMKYGKFVEKYKEWIPEPRTRGKAKGKKECAVCGCLFTPSGGNAKYCKACILEGKKRKEREWRQKTTGKELPSMSNRCKVCGREFSKSHGAQQYCPECKAERLREYQREYRRKRRMENGKGNKAGDI